MTDLAKRLNPPSLDVSDADIRTQAAEEQKTDRPEPEPIQNPRLEEAYTFPFSFTDARGRTYTGTFTNHILNTHEKMQVAILNAQYNAGLPYESIEGGQQVVNRGIAWMTYSLRGRSNLVPKGWADNLRQLKNDDLIIELFSEVSAHEGFFHGRITDNPASQDPAADPSEGA